MPPERAPRGWSPDVSASPGACKGILAARRSAPARSGRSARSANLRDRSDEPDAISPAVQDRRPGGAARDPRARRRAGGPERRHRDRGGCAGRVPHQPRLRPRGAGANPRRGTRPLPVALARRQLPRGDRPGRVSGARPTRGGGGRNRRLLGGRRTDRRARAGGRADRGEVHRGRPRGERLDGALLRRDRVQEAAPGRARGPRDRGPDGGRVDGRGHDVGSRDGAGGGPGQDRRVSARMRGCPARARLRGDAGQRSRLRRGCRRDARRDGDQPKRRLLRDRPGEASPAPRRHPRGQREARGRRDARGPRIAGRATSRRWPRT